MRRTAKRSPAADARPRQRPVRNRPQRGQSDDPHYPAAGSAAAAGGAAPLRVAALCGGLGTGKDRCRRRTYRAGRLLHRPRRLSQGVPAARYALPTAIVKNAPRGIYIVKTEKKRSTFVLFVEKRSRG